MNIQDANTESSRMTSRLNCSLQEFEDDLSQRTKVPPERIVEFLSCSNSELESQAQVIEDVEKRFFTLLERCEANPANIGPYMRALDPKTFSRDHGWRNLVQTLNAEAQGAEDFKRLALTKYLEYLSFRKELLHFICSRRSTASQVHEVPVNLDEALRDPPSAPAGALKETDAFGMTRSVCMPMASDNYVKLPDKETVEFTLGAGETMEVFLASHRFEISGGPDASLMDEQGMSYPLPEGRVSVGRHIDNDIMLDPRYQEVSRFHLIIDREEPDIIRLTDLSSFGSFVAANRMSRRGMLR